MSRSFSIRRPWTLVTPIDQVGVAWGLLYAFGLPVIPDLLLSFLPRGAWHQIAITLLGALMGTLLGGIALYIMTLWIPTLSIPALAPEGALEQGILRIQEGAWLELATLVFVGGPVHLLWMGGAALRLPLLQLMILVGFPLLSRLTCVVLVTQWGKTGGEKKEDDFIPPTRRHLVDLPSAQSKHLPIRLTLFWVTYYVVVFSLSWSKGWFS